MIFNIIRTRWYCGRANATQTRCSFKKIKVDRYFASDLWCEWLIREYRDIDEYIEIDTGTYYIDIDIDVEIDINII